MKGLEKFIVGGLVGKLSLCEERKAFLFFEGSVE